MTDATIDEETRRHAAHAVERLEAAIEYGPRAPHQEIADGVQAVIDFRNHVIDMARENGAPAWCVDEANALVSLSYGTEYPLIGFHLHRLEQTRDGMKNLLSRM